MGCCHSTDNAAPPDQIDGARDGIAAHSHNSSQAGVNRSARSLSDVGSQRGVVRGADERPNQPLQLPTPVLRSPSNLPQHPPPWTRSLLERKRAEFFDTQLSGDPQAWIAIRRVCELLREPNLADAQAVLDAAALTTPRGQVGRAKNSEGRRGGVYDSVGHFYEIPAWVVAGPLDTVEDEAEKDEVDAADGVVDDDTDDDDPKHTPSPRREEKGKGRAQSPGRVLQVKCRRSDKGRDVLIDYNEKEPAAALAHPLRDKVGDKRVRLLFRGRPLDEQKTLAQQGWKEGQVINAFVDGGD